MSIIDTRQDHLACPACGRTYALGSEEYCADDGERLEIRLGVTVDQAAPAQTSAQSPTDAQASASPAVANTQAAPEAAPEPTQAAANPGPAPAQSAVAAGAAAASPAPAPSRLESLLDRMGVRKRKAPNADERSAATATSARDASGTEKPATAFPAAQADDNDNPLPPQLMELGWQVAAPLTSNEAADVWPVTRPSEAGPALAWFSRFRARVLTTPALYQRLCSHTCAALPILLSFGTVNLKGNAQASFELRMFPARQPLQPLSVWLALASPSEAKALALLPHLVDMLTALSAAGVQPISFQPSQLLRHEGTGQLMLDNLAALAEIGQAVQTDYRPELDQNALISRLWSAPELAEQLVVSPKGAVFCVGQLLALALWGQPQDLAALRAGNIPFHTIADARLARILQGCLWVSSIEGRWSLDQLQTAVAVPLDQLPPVDDWAQLGPRAMSNAFALAGRTYWRVEDLLAQAVLPQNWPQATAQIGAMLDWIESGSPWSSLAAHQRTQLESGRSADYVLIQLAHGVIPDLPRTWRGLDFSDAHARTALVHLAQRNLAANTTAEEAEQLETLFLADLRGAFLSPRQAAA